MVADPREHGPAMPRNAADEITTGKNAPNSARFKLEEFLPHRLNVLSSVASQALSKVYAARYKIGIPEWRVLVTLGHFGIMTGKAVGDYSHMHKTKVSRAVAVLEQRKLVARKVNSKDMREALLTLTPAGRAIYDEVVPVALEFTQQLLNVVEPADRPALDRALTRLTERCAELANEQNRR
jgi:DNA-binding MarR family transcriptional regulator